MSIEPLARCLLARRAFLHFVAVDLIRKRVSRGDTPPDNAGRVVVGFCPSTVIWLASLNAECTELEELSYYISNIRSLVTGYVHSLTAFLHH